MKTSACVASRCCFCSDGSRSTPISAAAATEWKNSGWLAGLAASALETAETCPTPVFGVGPPPPPPLLACICLEAEAEMRCSCRSICILLPGSSAPSTPSARSSSRRSDGSRSDVSMPSSIGSRSGKRWYGSPTLPVARTSCESAPSAAWRRARLAWSRSASTIGGSSCGENGSTAAPPTEARLPSARSTDAETDGDSSWTRGSVAAKMDAVYGWMRCAAFSRSAPSSLALSSRCDGEREFSMSVISWMRLVRSTGSAYAAFMWQSRPRICTATCLIAAFSSLSAMQRQRSASGCASWRSKWPRSRYEKMSCRMMPSGSTTPHTSTFCSTAAEMRRCCACDIVGAASNDALRGRCSGGDSSALLPPQPQRGVVPLACSGSPPTLAPPPPDSSGGSGGAPSPRQSSSSAAWATSSEQHATAAACRTSTASASRKEEAHWLMNSRICDSTPHSPPLKSPSVESASASCWLPLPPVLPPSVCNAASAMAAVAEAVRSCAESRSHSSKVCCFALVSVDVSRSSSFFCSSGSCCGRWCAIRASASVSVLVSGHAKSCE